MYAKILKQDSPQKESIKRVRKAGTRDGAHKGWTTRKVKAAKTAWEVVLGVKPRD